MLYYNNEREFDCLKVWYEWKIFLKQFKSEARENKEGVLTVD